MRVTSNNIGRDGRERHIFGGVEHTKFEACTERTFKSAIHIRFGDETAIDRFGNLIEDMIAAEVTTVLQSQRSGFSRIFRDFVIEMKI